jgi:hypothetical protein
MGARGPKRKNPIGTITPKGYVRNYHAPSGRQRLQHDVVWEQHHGTIPDGHDVHHINGDKTDNRIENLEILPKLDHKREHSGCYKDSGGKWIKPCRKCGKHKEVDGDYYVRKDGISPWCRACCIESAVLNKQKRRGTLVES